MGVAKKCGKQEKEVEVFLDSFCFIILYWHYFIFYFP